MAITAIADGIALYRVYGEADLLLYIGISKDFGRRWKQHAKQQPWWDEMRRLSVDCWYPSRGEAEAAETAAIAAAAPKYNIRKIGGPPAATPEDIELDRDVLVQGCALAMHSLWHDGCSWGRALQEATDRYRHLRRSEPQWMLKARRAVQDNWGPHDACSLCRRGLTRLQQERSTADHSIWQELADEITWFSLNG